MNAAEKKALFDRSNAGDAAAIETLKKIAGDGDLQAQTQLGWMYQYGRGVKTENDEAAYWYRRATEKGNAYAQNQLGLVLCNEWAVLSSHEESERWRTKAAEQGSKYFMYHLARDYEGGKHCIKKDYKKAMDWYLKAGEQGDYEAFWALGIMVDYGHGVSKNAIEEYKWFFLARAVASVEDDRDGRLSSAISNTAREMTDAQLITAKQVVADWVSAHSTWEWCDSIHLSRNQVCKK